MKVLPKIGDIVVVTCKGYRRIQCIVTENFHTPEINLQQKDEFYLGDDRTHTKNNTYLKMEITHVYEPESIRLRGFQRTWTKLPFGETILPLELSSNSKLFKAF